MKHVFLRLITIWVAWLSCTGAQAAEEREDLFDAAADGDTAAVVRILEARPEAARERRVGLLPVHVAASRGKREVLQEICRLDPSLLHSRTRDGSSLIELSMAGPHPDVTVWLIEKLSPETRATALNEAASSALELYPRSLAILLDAGWRPQSKQELLDLLGWTLQLDDVELFKKARSLGIAAAFAWDVGREPPDRSVKINEWGEYLDAPQIAPIASPLRPAKEPFSAEFRSLLKQREVKQTLSLLLNALFEDAPHGGWEKDIKAVAFESATYGDLAVLKSLFATGRLDINAASEGKSLLQVAKGSQNSAMVRWLIRHGAKAVKSKRQ